MRALIVTVVAIAAVCAEAGPVAKSDVVPNDKCSFAPDLSVSQPVRASDGYGAVARANALGAEGKWDEGRAFITELRARPADKRNLEERQSVDMAEFALLRYNLDANKERCIECLKAVYDTGSTSFWGWAAYSFLKELGVDVPMPPKDPLRGLGAWGDGVVNLEPKRLESDAGRKVSDVDWLAAATNAVPITGPADLQPGSSVRRAILRKRLVETCGAAKIRGILAAKGGEALFARLWDDDATLEDFLLSGLVFNAPLALETLMTLFLNDEKEEWSKTAMGRKATVAAAINAQKGDDMKATVRHWAAFRRIGMENRFVAEAAKRDCREWRFIVRRPADAAETLYLNAQRRFPTRRPGSVSRNVPYRKTNCFGASKFRKFRANMKAWEGYMRPWEASGLPRLYLRNRVGGVCVEVSHWSARAANSQGIMAVTCNQPGRPPHLCWIMRGEDGNWRIHYRVYRYSNKCFTLWGNGFQYLQSTERAFADRTAHDESELLLFAGRVKEAAMRCPYNYTAWRAYANSLKSANASIDEWRAYLGELVKLQPEGRLITWNFAHEALDIMQKKGMEKAELAKEMAAVFRALPQPKSYIGEEINFRGDALVRISSGGKGNTPEDYARVSDATPYDPKRNGLFTTKAEDAPWAIVELAGDVEIMGVTVVGTAKGLSFWLSDDGDEWRKVGESASAKATADERGAHLRQGYGGLAGNGERVDLRKDSPTAKFVKVGFEPGGGKKPLSLKKILVYGNKLY